MTAIQAQCGTTQVNFVSYGNSQQHGTCAKQISSELEDPIDDIYEALETMVYSANKTVAWNKDETFHLLYSNDSALGVYYDDNLNVRYVTQVDETYGTFVADFGKKGLVDTNFTYTDFGVSQCDNMTQPYLALATGDETVNITIPSEIEVDVNTYTIDNNVLTWKSESKTKLSSTFNAMYQYENDGQYSYEVAYNGTSGNMTAKMFGMCFYEQGEVADISLLVWALDYVFNSASYIGQGQFEYSSHFNDTATYHRGYVSSTDQEIYYSKTTGAIKYLLEYNEEYKNGTLQVYSDDSW